MLLAGAALGELRSLPFLDEFVRGHGGGARRGMMAELNGCFPPP
jgi:hypothetical protein